MEKNNIEINSIEKSYTANDLIMLADLVGKSILMNYALNVITVIIGELVLKIIKIIGISLDQESFSTIVSYIGTIFSEIITFMWIAKQMKIKIVDIVKKKEKPGRDIRKYVYFLFTAQLIGILAYLVIQEASAIYGVSWEGIALQMPASSIFMSILYFIFVCIAVPIAEELLFRGAILKSLLPYGKRVAIIASAALFGLLHGNFMQIPFAFLAGIIFGYIAVKSDSIYYSIVLHIINNTWSALNELAYINKSVISIIFSMALVLFGFVGLIILIRDRKKILNFSDNNLNLDIEDNTKAYKYLFKSFWMWCTLIIMIIFCLFSGYIK